MIELSNDYVQIIRAKTQSQRELLVGTYFGKTYEEFLRDLEVEVKTQLVFGDVFRLAGISYEFDEDGNKRKVIVRMLSEYIDIDDVFLGALKLVPGINFSMQYDQTPVYPGLIGAQMQPMRPSFQGPRELTLEIDLSLMPSSFDSDLRRRFDVVWSGKSNAHMKRGH